MSHPISISLLPLSAKLLKLSILAALLHYLPFFNSPTRFYPYHSTLRALINQNNHGTTTCQSQILCSHTLGTEYCHCFENLDAFLTTHLHSFPPTSVVTSYRLPHSSSPSPLSLSSSFFSSTRTQNIRLTQNSLSFCHFFSPVISS